jgi:hypothetical protein
VALAVRDQRQGAPHVSLKSRALKGELDIETLELTGEVTVELTGQ